MPSLSRLPIIGLAFVFALASLSVTASPLRAAGGMLEPDWATVFSYDSYNSVLAATDDGSLYVGGESYDSGSGFSLATLHKISTTGEIEWSKYLTEAAGTSVVEAITEAPGGGVYVLLLADNFAGTTATAVPVVMRFSADGQWLWTFNFYDYHSSVRLAPSPTLEVANDGSLYIGSGAFAENFMNGGNTGLHGTAFIMHLSSAGGLINTHLLDTNANSNVSVIDLSLSPDGTTLYASGIAATPTNNLFGQPVSTSAAKRFVVSLNASSYARNWADVRLSSAFSFAQGLAARNDGVYAAPSGDTNATVRSYGSDGSVLWERSLTGAGSDVIRGLIVSNGYLYAVGDTNSSSLDGASSNGGEDIFIVGYNAAGDIVMPVNLQGGSGDESVYDIGRTYDNAIYAVGWTSHGFGGLSVSSEGGGFIARWSATSQTPSTSGPGTKRTWAPGVGDSPWTGDVVIRASNVINGNVWALESPEGEIREGSSPRFPVEVDRRVILWGEWTLSGHGTEIYICYDNPEYGCRGNEPTLNGSTPGYTSLGDINGNEIITTTEPVYWEIYDWVPSGSTEAWLVWRVGSESEMLSLNFAEPADATGITRVEVQPTISITAPAILDFGAGLPGDIKSLNADVTVTTNNANGYELSRSLSDLTSAGSDVIPASALTLTMDGQTSVSTSSRTASVGTAHSIQAQVEIPFVNSDLYSGTAVFTATAS